MGRSCGMRRCGQCWRRCMRRCDCCTGQSSSCWTRYTVTKDRIRQCAVNRICQSSVRCTCMASACCRFWVLDIPWCCILLLQASLEEARESLTAVLGHFGSTMVKGAAPHVLETGNPLSAAGSMPFLPLGRGTFTGTNLASGSLFVAGILHLHIWRSVHVYHPRSCCQHCL